MEVKMTRNVIQDKLKKSLTEFKNNIAIECGSQLTTYHELDRRSNNMANWMMRQSIQKGAFVGILADDRREFITAMIALLKVGGVFVALDSANPLERLGKMAAITQLKLIFIDRINYRRYSGDNFIRNSGIEFVVIEDLFENEEADESNYHPIPEVDHSPEDRIYVYFTSGTSGLPKAVVGKNKSLRHYVEWEVDTFRINESFRMSQLSTTGFDAFLKEVFVTLFSGGTLCVPHDMRLILSSLELVEWLEKSEIHLLHCVPGIFHVLCSGDLTGNCFSHLKYILMSGEKILPSDLRKWYGIFDERVQLVNLYGTTESTILKTCYFIDKADADKNVVPIGKPIRGSRMIILDENMNICNKGIIGEIYIRTPYLTSGYYNDPDLTKKRFIQNPFSDNPDDIIYRTGDLGRFLLDGNVECLGRIDRQVKVRGNRIELEEIENALLNYRSEGSGFAAQINDVVVLAKKDEENNNYLCAYFISNQELAAVELRDYLLNELPDYMIPAYFVRIEEMPFLPNGKIDMTALPDPAAEIDKHIVSPGNELEERLAAIWSDVLRMDKDNISVVTNFFELGGHSLNVMSLISLIHKEFDVRIPVGDIFNNPTIEKQAEFISHSPEYSDKFVSIQPVEEKEYYPVSSGQKRLYVWQQMSLDSTVYNTTQVVVLEGEQTGDLLAETFRKLINRHESLRTSFLMICDEPLQRIHDYEDVGSRFQIENFECKLKDDNMELRAIEIQGILGVFIRPFDLGRPPLFRTAVIKAGRDSYVLVVDMHHIISDGRSNDILVKEFKDLYKGQQMPNLYLQYRDFSEWQNRISGGGPGSMNWKEEYWLKQFEGDIPVLDLPTDFARPLIQNFDGGSVYFEIEEETADALKALALKEGVTLYILFLGLFNVLLSRLSGQEDIIVGILVEGRRHVDLENIIGFFVNTLPLRNFPSGEKPFLEFLKEVKENTLNALENQDYPFENLVEKLKIERDTNRNPLFNVTIEIRNLDPGTDTDGDVRSGGAAVLPVDMEREARTHMKEMRVTTHNVYQKKAPFDLDFSMSNLGRNIIVRVLYMRELFKEESIKRFVSYFKDLVSSVLDINNAKLEDMKISHDLVDVVSIEAVSEQGDFEF